jgi:serine protease Do
MNNWIKTSSLIIAAAIGFSASAQNTKDKNANNSSDRTEEIIIRKKGDKADKTTIVVDGDRVTINGKPVDEFRNDNLTVLRRKGSDVERARERVFSTPQGSFRMFDNRGEFAPARSNKAVLGVVTGKADDGARITSITKESAAEKAGLQKDDVITQVGSKKIEDPDDLVESISNYKPNDKVDITYKRNGKENKTSATLNENRATAFSYNFNNPDFNINIPKSPTMPEGFNFNYSRKPRVGLQIQDVEDGKGVTVKDVDDDSPASKAGMKEGDVITQVNGKEIAGVDDIRNEIKDIKEGDTVQFSYKRGGKTQTAQLKFPKKLRTANL